MSLRAEQIEHFHDQGWIAPVDVCSEADAAALLAAFEDAEQRYPEDLGPDQRNNAHLVFPFLADLARHPTIVSAATALVGGPVTLWSSVVFAKDPDSSAFVSWHQDAHYMGLEPDNFVTAWVALTPSTRESGCVTVLPGTHRRRYGHVDTFGRDNILTRGQEVAGLDTSTAVDLVLRPGQMSLHHPWLVHGSQPNRSSRRRIGVAMQSYLGPDVRPTRGEHHVFAVSDSPIPEPFIESPAPTGVCTPEGREARARANAAFADVLYDGAERRRSI